MTQRWVFFTVTVAVHLLAQVATAAISKSEINQKVQSLISQMSLEEKVGQMTQVTLQVISKPSISGSQYHELDPVKLEDALVNHHVGSILNVIYSAFSVDHWQNILTQIQEVALNKTPHSIPILYGIDAIHGATYTLGSTLFPQSIAMAATWNPDLVRWEGEVVATEVRASGIPWNFSPVLDIGRQPLWSRFWETYGEDVHLATTLGTAYIEGHQGNLQGNLIGTSTHAATCLKHFMGYSYPLSGKDRTPAWLSEGILREYFLPTFEAGIRAGAPSIMINSSEIDGVPVHSNYHLLTEILRNELHFEGVTVSDWEDIKRLYTRDRVASSPEEAVRMAVMAGVDMSMVPLDFSFYEILIQLVKDGKVPIARIDEAVSRILHVKFQVGLFERPYPDPRLKSEFGRSEFTRLSRQAAQESITLLKNSNEILPLSKNKKVLVTGPSAHLLSALNGGWTVTWQGDSEDLYPKDKLTILQAIQNKLGAQNVSFVPGSTYDRILDLDAVVNAAYQVDAVVVCLGEKPYTETPGNIEDLTLEKAQLDLASALIKTGKPVILVLTEGRPRVIRQIVDGVQGILMAYLPGMEGGPAIADILFGEVNPSGKLPMSYPRAPNSIVPYDHVPMEEVEGNTYDPEFPFGFGLSYTSFEVSNLQLSVDSQQPTQTIEVSVSVTNRGNRAGKETVQLYLTDLYGSVARPVQQIRGFQKVELNPQETKRILFTLTPNDLTFIGRDYRRILEPGEFKVKIGPLEKRFQVGQVNPFTVFM